ncbi:MAG: DUF4878 domain-containing protein [Chitinophagaceae bacterium]
MKKIMRLFPLLAAVSLFTISCGGGSMSNAGPKEVLTEFFKKIAAKDIDGAAKLATKESKSTMDMMKKAMDMSEKMKDQATEADKDMAEEFKDVEIGDAKIDGDMATVPFKNKKKNQEMEFPLKKEDGAWKVDFSMATLMKMGMDAKKDGMMDHEMDGNDTMENMDAEKVKDGLKMADSLLQKIDPEKLKELQESMKKIQQNQ